MSKSVFTKNKLKIFFIFLLSAVLLAIGAAVGLYYHFGHALADSEPSEEMRGKMLYGNSFTVQELVDDTQYPYAWLSAKTTQVEVYANNEQGESVLTTDVLSFDAATRSFCVIGVGEGKIRFVDGFDKTVTHSVPFKTAFRSVDTLTLLGENYPQFFDDGIIDASELASMQFLTVRDMQSIDLADVAFWTGLEKLTIKNAVGAGLLEIENFLLPEKTNIYVAESDYLAYVNRTDGVWQDYAERIFPAPLSLEKNSIVFYKNGGTFAQDNGSLIATAQVADGETLSISTDFAIEREGYQFVGWFFAPDGVTAVGSALTDDYRFDADAKVCAQWQANRYTVRAHHNNGTDDSTEKAFVYDAQDGICDTPIEYNGYVQIGWAYTADATTPVFENAQTVKNLTSVYDGVVDLYAVWVYQTFSIQFYTWNDNKEYKTYGSAKSASFGDTISLSLTAGTPSSVYGSFVGWAFTENASKATYEYNESVDSTALAAYLTSNTDGILRVYSVIQLEAYDLLYDANGGSVTPEAEKARARGVSVNLHKQIEREGYKFKGWLDNAGWLWTSETLYANDEAYYNEKYPNREVLLENEYGYVAPRGMEHVQGAQVVLTAVWEVNTFSVVFTGNHSSAGYQKKTPAKYGRAFEFGYPVNVGHRITSFTSDYGNLTLSNSATELTGEQVNTVYRAIKAAQGVSDNDFDCNTATLTLSVTWTANTYTVKFDSNGGSACSAITVTFGKTYGSLPTPSRSNYNDGDYTHTYRFNYWTFGGSRVSSSTVVSRASDHQLVANWSVSSSKNPSCFMNGTMITLADGTKKPIEEVQRGDMLLAINHHTGELGAYPATVFIHYEDEWTYHRICELTFDDGTILKIVKDHALFNRTLNSYVNIGHSNAQEYLGHSFYSVQMEDGALVQKNVKLVSYKVYEEYCGSYTLLTAYAWNIFAEGVLSAPSGGDICNSTEEFEKGLLNLFHFNEDLSWDSEEMESDIALYGLYTYDEFAEYMSKPIFDMFNVKYFKIMEAKGLIDSEILIEKLKEYSSALQ